MSPADGSYAVERVLAASHDGQSYDLILMGHADAGHGRF